MSDRGGRMHLAGLILLGRVRHLYCGTDSETSHRKEAGGKSLRLTLACGDCYTRERSFLRGFQQWVAAALYKPLPAGCFPRRTVAWSPAQNCWKGLCSGKTSHAMATSSARRHLSCC